MSSVAIPYRIDPDGRIAVPAAHPLFPLTKTSAFPCRDQLAPTDATGASWVYREVTDLAVAERWWPLALRVSTETGCPVSWIMACLYTESRGNERAEAPDGGWGLMQITHPSLKAGYTKEQVFEPETNVRIGARALARHGTGAGRDAAKVASCYNAGGAAWGVPHASGESPWGYRETRGHISRFVAANNAAVAWVQSKGEAVST